MVTDELAAYCEHVVGNKIEMPRKTKRLKNMNRNTKNLRIAITATAALLVCLTSCTKTPNHSRYPGTGGGETDKPSGNTPKPVQRELNLTEFGKLNAGQSDINSHANDWDKSILSWNCRSYVELGASAVGHSEPTYGRMLKLADGSYILLNQDRADVNGNGESVYWSVSTDMKNWTSKGKLFASEGSNTGDAIWTNGNGIVLKNGDVIVFASYRTRGKYNTYANRFENGIKYRRSRNNGKTWTAAKTIHRGPNWEAIMLELESGELQCYFSESRPWISGSHSGTSMVKSTDGGETWSPAVFNSDGSQNTGYYPYRVIRHTYYSEDKGQYLFTDQMPNLIVLNNSKQIAGVFESASAYPKGGNPTFNVSFAWSPEDGNWDIIEGDEGDGKSFDVEHAKVGPAERVIDIWRGGAPDLKQFPSGETVVSYGSSEKLNLRLGDSKAKNWGEPIIAYPGGRGSWGAMMMDNSHEVAALIRNSKNSSNVTIAVSKFALNHWIKAASHSVKNDGDNEDWSTEDEALFTGAACQAQATLRCAADKDSLYFLVECLDENVSKDDYFQLYIAPSGQTSLDANAARVKVGPEGLRSQCKWSGQWVNEDKKVKVHTSYDATLSDKSDKDNGWLAEISIPRSSLKISSDGKVKVNLSLFDLEGGESAIVSTNETNPDKWMSIQGL